jgi:hypothetical protein
MYNIIAMDHPFLKPSKRIHGWEFLKGAPEERDR